MSGRKAEPKGKVARRRALSAPSPLVKDLRDKVHVHAGRSLRSRMLLSRQEAVNGKPEFRPYVWRAADIERDAQVAAMVAAAKAKVAQNVSPP